MTPEEELQRIVEHVGVIPMTDRAVLSVAGEDAREWLQGQVTNQLEGAEPGESVYAFVLTLKGRTLADVFVLVGEHELLLDVPSAAVDALLQRLDRYIIMEDVDLEHREDLRLVAAVGPKASAVGDDGWSADRLGVGGRQWVVPAERLAEAVTAMCRKAEDLGGGPVSEAGWEYAHVVRGRPRFGHDFGDWTYPQETGLRPVAVSFNKGCYIGQETVVMLENRGKAPKLLWRWRIDTEEAPAPGSAIEREDARVGDLRSSVRTKDGVLALGFLKRGHEADADGDYVVDGSPARALGPVEGAPAVSGST